jgi:hypothetical protein
MSNDELYTCRICGLHRDEPPWGPDGVSPTFEICDCCGVEFGYEDSTLDGVKRYRQEWVSGGCEWFVPKAKPDGWTWEQQKGNVPKRFR